MFRRRSSFFDAESGASFHVARIEGEVRLVVVLDPQTGLIKEVKVTSGNPLLTDAAVAAVRDWHFQEGNPRKDSLEVALRFVLRCPSD